jgi:Zn-dependent peptidase ImmA (M78 family)
MIVVNVWGMEIYFYCYYYCVNVITFVPHCIDCSSLTPNVILATYAIVKKSHNELSFYCMTFTYLYNKCSPLIILVNNCMVSYGKNFILFHEVL